MLDISGAVTVFDFESSGSLGRGESAVIGTEGEKVAVVKRWPLVGVRL